MATQISIVQASLLRNQAARLTASGPAADEEVLGFYISASDELAGVFAEAIGEEGLVRMEARFKEAQARLAAARNMAAREAAEKAAAAKAGRVYTAEESCVNAARELAKWGPRFEAAAKAMEADTAREAAWIAAVLGRLLSSGRLKAGSWMLAAVRRQHEAAGGVAREEEEKAVGFLEPLLRALKNFLAGEGALLGAIRQAKSALANNRPADKWPVWALKALERAIDARPAREDLYEALVELADPIKAALPEHRAATAFIDGLRDRVAAEAAKAEAARRAAKDAAVSRAKARKAERAIESRKMRGSHSESPLVGQGRKSPRRDNDPHRHGK